MAVDDTFASLQAVQAGAPVTSKKSMQMNARFGSYRKFTMPAGRLVEVHEKFPVDLGHKEL